MTIVAICHVIPKRMRPSGTVTEIWRLKDNGVTTLTFWDHGTSSVTYGHVIIQPPGFDFLSVVH